MEKHAKAYIFEIHIIRAIACLLVLFVHVTATYYYQQGGFNTITFFFNQIGRFGTPLFAVISGFLLFYQVRKKGFRLKKFVTSRLVKIGAPFVVWSIFYILLMFVMEGQNPLDDGKKNFSINFLLGNSYVHLYFMSIVFQFYVLFPLLQLFRSKRSWTMLLILSLGINFYLVHYYSPPADMSSINYVINQRAFFLNWIFFFIFGGFAAYNWESLQHYAKKYKLLSILALAAVALFTIIEYKTKGSVSSNRPLNFIHIPIILFSLIGLYDHISKSKWINAILVYIGKLSMGIYLVHMFIIYVFVHTMPAGIWTTIYFPFVFMAILLSSILFIKLIQQLPMNQYFITVPKVKSA